MRKWSALGVLTLSPLLAPAHLQAHDNTIIHPFGISDDAVTLAVTDKYSPYAPLMLYYNRSQDDAPDYRPEDVNSEVCKPGTRGTIDEDEHFLQDNWLPYLDHFWNPWNPFGCEHNALRYAPEIFDRAVALFADGREEEAFFHFGRCTHVLEDMGSIPHLFSDLHPSILVNFSGYERWCKTNEKYLHTGESPRHIVSLGSAMAMLGQETFRAARIAGTLNRDSSNPIDGDLGEMFPGNEDAGYAKYVPTDPFKGLRESWWLKNVGSYTPGEQPTEDEADRWGEAPPLPGESEGHHYYIQYNQDNVIPASVWSVAEQAFVPNVFGYTLTHLWAGATGYRATPDQAHEMIPRTIEYAAGFMKHLWDFINPPPHLSGVRIEQDQNGDGEIDPAVDVILDSTWISGETLSYAATRELMTTQENPAVRLPTRFVLRFSEDVRNVVVVLGQDGPAVEIARGVESVRGPPTQEFPDGEPQLLISGVNLSALPDGKVRLFVQAEDLSNHLPPVVTTIDPDPSTRAGRLPDGSWRNIESGAPYAGWDAKHTFELGGIQVRTSSGSLNCKPGNLYAREISVRNLSLAEGSEVTLEVESDAVGWGTNAAALTGLTMALPAPGADWRAFPTPLNVSCTTFAAPDLRTFITASAGGAEDRATLFDTTAAAVTPPGNDHPDDTRSVADPRFPTPWLVDPAARIGVLLNGWGAGIGHLLGSYGIATAQVPDDLVLPTGDGNIDALEVLVVGSGGLTGLDRQPSFREKLDRYVAEGGALVVFTPQRGEELAALPGGQVAGYGWSEDQACFGTAVRIAARDPALAGQTTPHLDVGADGYLTRWPDAADVLLTRTSNDQPAMIRYRHGRGLVYVATLYPDWAYGSAQSGPHERALVRDVVTAALAHPAAIPECAPGDAVSLSVPVHNATWVPTASISLDPRTPNRAPLASTTAEQALEPTAFFDMTLPMTAPSPGVLPVGYRLFDAEGRVRQTTADAAFLAVYGTQPVAPQTGTLRMWVTVPSDSVPVGGETVATIHFSNGTDQDLQGALAVSWFHFWEGPLKWIPDVTVPANGTASFVVRYPVVSPRPFTLVYGLFDAVDPAAQVYDQKKAITQVMKGYQTFEPLVTLEVSPAADELYPGEPLPVTARISSTSPAALSASMSLSLRGSDNRTLWTGQHVLEIPAHATVEFPTTVQVSEAAPGLVTLEAELRQAGRLIGYAARMLVQPRPSLEVTPGRPSAWKPLEPGPLTFSLRNTGARPIQAGTLTAVLSDDLGAPRWTATGDIPPLPGGAVADVSLVADVPLLRFADHQLRWTASVPEGSVDGSIVLRNAASVSIVAGPALTAVGETVSGTVSVANEGDFAIAGLLSVGSPGIVAEGGIAVDVRPGESAALPFSGVVGDGVSPGAHAVVATFRSLDEKQESVIVTIPPSRLVFEPFTALVAAGATLPLRVTNAGGVPDVSVWAARLFRLSDDPSDPLAVQLAGAQRLLLLAPGESTGMDLQIPAHLASGTYAISHSALDQSSGRTVAGRSYVSVAGVEATLTVGTDREVYAAADPITASATIVNGAVPLAAGALELAVRGVGVLEPVAFVGTVHVSPAGDDATGDGSLALPYATPQRGVDTAPAGHRVLLLAGTYGGHVVLKEGTILQGEVLAGQPAAILAGSDVIGASGSTVDHLAIHDGNVVFRTAVSGVRVTDCVFAGGTRTVDLRGQGVVFKAAASAVLIGRNRLTGYARRNAGFQFYGVTHDVLIHGNTLVDFTLAMGNAGVVFWSGVSDAVVQENLFASLAGGASGIQFWGGAASTRNVRVLSNRVEYLTGGSDGVHFWCPVEAVRVSGNHFAALEGSAMGIHFWERAVGAEVADNVMLDVVGDSAGIQLWETGGLPHLDVRIENNLLADFFSNSEWSAGSGIVTWEATERLRISRNVIERLWSVAPPGRDAGIQINAPAAYLLIERNVVRDVPGGVALRLLPRPLLDPVPLIVNAELANNLLLADGVGLFLENVREVDDLEVRDGIVAGNWLAGVQVIADEGLPCAAPALHHMLFFDNTANADGFPEPVGRTGNISADPQFGNAAASDYRLLEGSPCIDAGSLPLLDIGPLDDDQAIALGPRRVARDGLGGPLWSAVVPLDLGERQAIDLNTPVSLPAVGGTLVLEGRVLGPDGQRLAAAGTSFTIQTDPVLLGLSTPRSTYAPGEPITITVEAINTAPFAVTGLLVKVLLDDEEVFAVTTDLAAGEAWSTPFTMAAEVDFSLHASAGLAAADLSVAVSAPTVSVGLEAPAEAGDTPFIVAARVENVGRVPAALRLELAGTTEEFTLQPGAGRTFVRTFQIAGDTILVATLDGDVSAKVRAFVRYGPRVTVALEVPALLAAGPATGVLRCSNGGTVGAALQLDVDLSLGDGTPLNTWAREFWLEPATGIEESLDLGALAPGDYVLRANGGPEPVTVSFRVAPGAAPRLIEITPGSALDDAGRLPVRVRVANDGAAELPAVLSLSTPLSHEETSITLGACDERAVTFVVPVSGATAGDYPAVAAMRTADGTRLEAVATLHISPSLSLVSVPAELYLVAGVPQEIAVSVANTGLARGAARVRVSAGELFRLEQEISAAAATETPVAFNVTLPADLPAYVPIPGVVSLADVTGRAVDVRDFVIYPESALSLFVRGDLDRPTYADGDLARFTLSVANTVVGTAALRAVVGHADLRSWSEFVVAPAGQMVGLQNWSVGSVMLEYSSTTGVLTSSALDLADTAGATIAWEAEVPAGSSLVVETRTGCAPEPDETWAAWSPAAPGVPVGDRHDRFLQYRVMLTKESGTFGPLLHEVRIAPLDGERRIVHTTHEDFTFTPLQVATIVPIDFTASGSLFFGVYASSGRSLVLDTLPIGRAGAQLQAWTDRMRYGLGETITLGVAVEQAGTLNVSTPWDTIVHAFGGPGTMQFQVQVPLAARSGTYLISATFLGEQAVVPVEVVGHDVSVLEARLEEGLVLSGGTVAGEVLLASRQPLDTVTIDGWLSAGGETSLVFTASAALPASVTRIPFSFEVNPPRGGPAELLLTISLPVGNDPRALFLAGADVHFDIVAPNQRPSADAGQDLAVPERSWVALDARGSSDPDGDTLAYRWTQTQGPAASVYGADSALPVLFAPNVSRGGELLVFALQVSDGSSWSEADTVEVAVRDVNRPPVANAGFDAAARTGEVATISGTDSYDPDDDPLEFLWSLESSPTGSAAAIEGVGAAVGIRPDVPGDYRLSLVVSDGLAISEPDAATVSTVNSRPHADAGADRAAHPGEVVELDGSGSDDADGDPLTYRWTVVEEPPPGGALLEGETLPRPRLWVAICGSHRVELRVDDGKLLSEPDQVLVDCANVNPEADAGPDRAARLGETVMLDGGSSSDADGDLLAYRWAFTTRPAGSAAALSDPADATPSFVVDALGEYALTLTVSDGIADSVPDGVGVIVGTDVAPATIALKPSLVRLGAPAAVLRARIELPAGFSAREIIPASAAITAVGKRVLARPVRRIAARGAAIGDADRDGLEELTLYYPVKPLLPFLKAGTRPKLTFKGPFATWGRFVGSAALRVTP